jgi:hypothetical protein
MSGAGIAATKEGAASRGCNTVRSDRRPVCSACFDAHAAVSDRDLADVAPYPVIVRGTSGDELTQPSLETRMGDRRQPRWTRTDG